MCLKKRFIRNCNYNLCVRIWDGQKDKARYRVALQLNIPNPRCTVHCTTISYMAFVLTRKTLNFLASSGEVSA